MELVKELAPISACWVESWARAEATMAGDMPRRAAMLRPAEAPGTPRRRA